LERQEYYSFLILIPKNVVEIQENEIMKPSTSSNHIMFFLVVAYQYFPMFAGSTPIVAG